MTRSSSKRHLITLLAVVVAVVCCLGLAACSGSEKSSAPSMSNSITYTEGQPPLQPYSDHVGRWERVGAKGCYGCHGANDQANPQNAYAPAIPDDHYVNADSSTHELAGDRAYCIQCHPLDEPSA